MVHRYVWVCSTTCSSVLLLLTVHHLVYQDGVLLVLHMHTKNTPSFGHVLVSVCYMYYAWYHVHIIGYVGM